MRRSRLRADTETGSCDSLLLLTLRFSSEVNRPMSTGNSTSELLLHWQAHANNNYHTLKSTKDEQQWAKVIWQRSCIESEGKSGPRLTQCSLASRSFYSKQNIDPFSRFYGVQACYRQTDRPPRHENIGGSSLRVMHWMQPKRNTKNIELLY